MRLIDADKLIERINNAERISSIPYAEQMKSNLLFLAKTQQTIDAVEVVRCENCRYFATNYAVPHCGRTLIGMKKFDFCSYGERKEER